MALERELETYKQKLPELKEHEGKFVLIRGQEVAGVFAAYEDAINEGYRRFGLEAFLVKQISSIDRPLFIDRIAELEARVAALEARRR